LQDQTITESRGPIVNHDGEHLVSSDLMIAKTHLALIKAAKRVGQNNEPLAARSRPDIYYETVGGELITRRELPLSEAYRSFVGKPLV
jgi:hypothetical protein